MENNKKIVTTRERLLAATKDIQTIQRSYEFVNGGWIFCTEVTLKDQRRGAGHSFKKEGFDPVFPAAETAETISLGRALAALGYLIDDDLICSEELIGNKAPHKPLPEKTKSAHIKKEVNIDGKKIMIDTEKKGMTHEKHCEAIHAAATGDEEKVKKIVEQAKADVAEYVIPEMVETVKGVRRVFKGEAWTTFYNYLQSIGCDQKKIIEFANNHGHYDDKNYSDFLREAPNEVIDEFILFLKK